ncbi:iron-containing alcohol dehydrogenase [Entomohabitans teleogrylli]|uniref:iron-containing alcohol dehydrogenase n=1 Tax=Entomohabitans teleogrylli TaxID=1384589 RepID=UPI00073D5789|nr:iron-containing alcohol dehydrogenase [Entomohabitans teleogrylli]
MHADLQQALYLALDQMNAGRVTTFAVPPVILSGAGASARCGELLRQRGQKHVLVMVDSVVWHSGAADALARSLNRYVIAREIWPCPAGEPCDTDVAAAVARLHERQCDGIVALGGGSVLDAAKAVAVLATNPGLDLAQLNAASALRPRLPLTAIPTTAGSGSESTSVTVIIDAATHHKRVLAHATLMPDAAILDPLLTLGVPAAVTAMTGIDALTHAIEASVARHGTPLTQCLALQAVRMIGESLRLAVGCGDNLAAREAMLLASGMAGMAFSSAGLGLCHATAHQIGAAYRIPHGMANAIMLPAVMNYNRLACQETYARIGLALTQRHGDALAAIAAVEQLIAEVELEGDLSAIGAREADFAGFARDALNDVCITTNPRTVTEARIIALYQAS